MKRVIQIQKISSIANYFIASIQQNNPISYKLNKQGQLEPVTVQTNSSSLKQEHTCLSCKQQFQINKQHQFNNEQNQQKQIVGGRVKKKYRSYTVEFKKKIIDEIKYELLKSDNKISIYSLIKAKSEQYGVHVKNVRRWYGLKQIKQRQGGRKPMVPQLEQKMMEYLTNNRSCRRRDVVNFAKKYAQEMKIKQIENFSFSKGWYERFRVRYQRTMTMRSQAAVLKKQPGNQQQKKQLRQQDLQQKMKFEKISPKEAKNENIILVKMQEFLDDDNEDES